jgi:hypothetical protein
VGPTRKSLPNIPSRRKFPNLFAIYFWPIALSILTTTPPPRRMWLFIFHLIRSFLHCFMAFTWSADAREASGRNWHRLPPARDTLRRSLSTSGMAFRASRFSSERGPGETLEVF